MWPIIYRILVPGITLSVVAGLISLSSFRALKKGYNGKKTKKIKAEAVVFLMLSLEKIDCFKNNACLSKNTRL